MLEEVDIEEVKEVTEELNSLDAAQFRPDYIGEDENTIVMCEYDSSIIGTVTKKRYHVYVALYDYTRNPENKDIHFNVISTKEKSKTVYHQLNDTDRFKLKIINISELGFEKIINNTKTKIKKQEVFSAEELVKLALTCLMPETEDGKIEQFYQLKEMINQINYGEDKKAKQSFVGIILVLSNMYFEKDDPLRKELQRDFMNKVDCITEVMEEKELIGINKGMKMGKEEERLRSALKYLEAKIPIKTVSEISEIPEDKLKIEYEKYKEEKTTKAI